MKNRSILSENDSLADTISNLHAGEVIVIGSCPGMGKTFLALTMAAYMVLDKNKSIAFVSLESAKDVLLRRLAKIINSNVDDIQNPLFNIIDTPYMTIQELEQHIRLLQSEKKIEAVFIDYLGLLSAETNRAKEYAVMHEKLKTLAKELNISIITILQIHRDKAHSYEIIPPEVLSDNVALQSIDKIIFITQQSDNKKKELKVYSRLQDNAWISDNTQWTLPV